MCLCQAVSPREYKPSGLLQEESIHTNTKVLEGKTMVRQGLFNLPHLTCKARVSVLRAPYSRAKEEGIPCLIYEEDRLM